MYARITDQTRINLERAKSSRNREKLRQLSVERGHHQPVNCQRVIHLVADVGIVKEWQQLHGLVSRLRTSLIVYDASALRQSGTSVGSEADRHNLPLAIRASAPNYFQQCGTDNTANARNSKASRRLIKRE
jgi:hypothetical protein